MGLHVNLSLFFFFFWVKIQSLSRPNVVVLTLVQLFQTDEALCLAGDRILPTPVLCIKLYYVCAFSGCPKVQRKRKAMGKKGKESKKKKVEIQQWKINFHVKHLLMRNQGNDANIDSLHYLLPQIPVWTGKRSERTPQNQQIKFPMFLMCCWKKAPWSAVHCRLSSCSVLCAPQGEPLACCLLPHVAKRSEKQCQRWSLGFWFWVQDTHFLMFSPLYTSLVESNRRCCCQRNLGVWGIQLRIKTSASLAW